jgi:hypothetical protein
MIKFEVSPSGLWFTKSHKNEEVNHLFRIGTTKFDGMKIYEIIIWRLRIVWG